MTVLKTAIANYPHTKGLKDGTVSVPGVQFEHVEVAPIIGAFRRMCRTLEFDVCEMAITTYLTAKAHDKPFTALPIQIYNWTSLPQEEFQNLAAAAILVLLAILLTMNAFAIWLRNRYQRRW